MNGCKDCEWWQDYRVRVYARISEVNGPINGGLIELRRCKYDPPPNITPNINHIVYTDEAYCCSEFKKANETI